MAPDLELLTVIFMSSERCGMKIQLQLKLPMIMLVRTYRLEQRQGQSFCLMINEG